MKEVVEIRVGKSEHGWESTSKVEDVDYHAAGDMTWIIGEIRTRLTVHSANGCKVRLILEDEAISKFIEESKGWGVEHMIVKCPFDGTQHQVHKPIRLKFLKKMRDLNFYEAMRILEHGDSYVAREGWPHACFLVLREAEKEGEFDFEPTIYRTSIGEFYGELCMTPYVGNLNDYRAEDWCLVSKDDKNIRLGSEDE